MINLMQLVQMVNGGGNPMQMLMQAAPQNPLVGQVLQMTNGKTPVFAYAIISRGMVIVNKTRSAPGEPNGLHPSFDGCFSFLVAKLGVYLTSTRSE